MDWMTIERVRTRLKDGLVIPACPLALTRQRKFDDRRQRALFRYYLSAGAGGLAVGVHTTQFAIHNPQTGLYPRLLELAVEEIRKSGKAAIKVAGIIGDTRQAVHEASLAVSMNCDCGLLSLGGWKNASEDELIAHCQTVANILPVFGFYLQPAVGGRILSYAFWRRFLEIEEVVAVKIAPFNRYQTLDVMRALADSGRSRDIAVYTGNDDNIVSDLVTNYRFSEDGDTIPIVGGLLGHWAVWTLKAVELLEVCKSARTTKNIPSSLLAAGVQITDSNSAIFDVVNNFSGSIPGIHEVLTRQGLMECRYCLDPSEDLSPGQLGEIDRVYATYPHLNDDQFVVEHLEEFLA